MNALNFLDNCDKESTHLCLVYHKWDIGKQRRPRSDATERGVWSESTLFALSTETSVNHDNNKN